MSWTVGFTQRFLVALFLLLPTIFASAQTQAPYRYFWSGNQTDVKTKTQPGFALIGGGKDLDDAFLWLCQRSGGGDFLILRASGTDAYNAYVQGLCHQNSVSTLLIPSRAAAADPFVAETIGKAEAIFIAGGDQANYINFWKGTAVEDALNAAIARGVPIGGTSAGLAVQGEYIYSAQSDPPDGSDMTSAAALSNPFHPQVVIVRGFLHDPALRGVITDTHFVTRNRMGRLLVFMARALAQKDAPQLIKGIGIDEQTAVLMEPDGSSSVIGHGAAYFLSAARRDFLVIAGNPLSSRSISVKKVLSGGKFDLHTGKGNSTDYQLSVESGAIHSTQADGAIY